MLSTSVSQLASYEVFLLSPINITVVQCNSPNPEILLHPLQDEDIHDSVLLTNHLLIPRNDLQKTPMSGDFNAAPRSATDEE